MSSKMLFFLASVWEEFWKLSPLNGLLAVITLITVFGSPVAFIQNLITGKRRRVARMEKESLQANLDLAKADLRRAESAIRQQEAAISNLQGWVPRHVLEQVAHEREDLNEDRAVLALSNLMDEIGQDFGAVCLNLAQHHAERLFDDPDALEQAERLAHTAALLRGEDKGAQQLVSDLVEFRDDV